MKNPYPTPRAYQQGHGCIKPGRGYAAQWQAAQNQKNYWIKPGDYARKKQEGHYARIPYVEGQFYELSHHEVREENYDDSYCWWCLTNVGEYHVPVCLMELCPACQNQIVYCTCVIRGLSKQEFQD